MSVDGLFSTAQNNNFQLLHDLDLNDNMIKTVNFLKSPFNSLTGLHLSNNPLGINGLITLKTAIEGGSLSSLLTLDLKNCFTRNTHSNINPIEFSKFLRALSAHCQRLITIDLSHNNLGVTGAIELAKVRSQHIAFLSRFQNWWCQVKLTSTNLSDEALCSFAKELQCTWCFGALQLGDNDIHATGLGCLVEAIDKGKISVTKLELENNPLGLNGVTEIGKLLSINQDQLQLTCISLKNCQLADVLTYDQDVCDELLVEKQLCQMPQNTTLTELYLDGNRFTGDAIRILAGLMQLCLSLEILSTTDCSILSDDFNQLLDKLAHFMLSSDETYVCRKLRDWRLYSNKIDDRIESALMKHQRSSLFPNLTLNLSGNQISHEMTRMLIQEWNKRQEVRKHNNSIVINFVVIHYSSK
jgi:Ran GTPase-activating protein (RanGAP) involved in mRNA processing and transport